MLRVWMQDWAPPWPSQPQRPGRWIAEASWPSPRITSRRLHLTRVGLAPEANHAEEVTVSSPLTTGIAGGVWCPFTADGDLPIAQGWDDAGALTFDSALLSEPLEILGAVRLVLDLAIDRPNAMLAVRLNDLAPDGTSTRVTYGLLNLAQRTSREWPCPMRPGGREHVSMDLKHVGYRFGAGHRLRLAVSTCYWPIAWPPPHKVMLSIFSPASVLHLPVRSPSAEDVQLAPPLSAEQGGHDTPSNGGRRRSLERDLLSSEIRVITEEGADGGGVALEQIDAIGLQIGSRTLQEYLIKETDPLSAQARIERDVLLRRTDWFIQIEVRLKMRSTPDAFHLDASLRALEDDVEVCCRTWREVIPRDQRDS